MDFSVDDPLNTSDVESLEDDCYCDNDEVYDDNDDDNNNGRLSDEDRGDDPPP